MNDEPERSHGRPPRVFTAEERNQAEVLSGIGLPHRQIAVLIVPTVAPEAIEQYSLRVAEAWKIGRKKVDDGAILVVAKDDRKLRISVARVKDHLYAFDDLCTCGQEACPLSGGLLTGTTIMCQCHGSRFDITTGAVINGPATAALKVYAAQEAEDSVRIYV